MSSVRAQNRRLFRRGTCRWRGDWPSRVRGTWGPFVSREPGAGRSPAPPGKRTNRRHFSPLRGPRRPRPPLFLATLLAASRAAAGPEGRGRPARGGAGAHSPGGGWALGVGGRRAGERQGSALEAGLGAPGPRGVLFRSGRACPGHANQWALHTAPHRRQCHRTGADVTAQSRSAAPRPEASRLRPGDLRCAPPRRKQRLTRARNFSGVPGSLIRGWRHMIQEIRLLINLCHKRNVSVRRKPPSAQGSELGAGLLGSWSPLPQVTHRRSCHVFQAGQLYEMTDGH
ncbi:laforin-like [Balaenoptera musculus]|uniref:Laforin-like n=1 Tax=Balaenoptera musculus TaxID=9771 RepID=A0A8B8VQ66_BALMU|nr:laforin-like [Balaenoptera musculus]